MRFVPPVAALSSATVRFDGDPHARTRPMAEVLDRAAGVRCPRRRRGPRHAPVRRGRAGAVRGGQVTIDASASSQFISALLLAGARYDEGVDVLHDGKPVPSLPHIEMTIACLREHGSRSTTASRTGGACTRAGSRRGHRDRA
jgi:3-phosphoshikimate 1-carboxyvinyltransferase